MKLLCTVATVTKLTVVCLLLGFFAGLTVGTSMGFEESPSPPGKAHVQMDTRTMSR